MYTPLLTALAAVLVWLSSPVLGVVYAQQSGAGTGFSYLQERGIVSDARLNDALNRAEALKVVLGLQERYRERVRWYSEHRSSLPLFRDVSQSAWYAPYVEAGFETGVVTGYPDLTFRPATFLSAEEAIALLLRSYDVREDRSAGTPNWYVPYVEAALSRNLVPQSEQLWVGHIITRGQFFEIAYRMDSIHTQQRAAFPETQQAIANALPRILLPQQQALLRQQQQAVYVPRGGTRPPSVPTANRPVSNRPVAQVPAPAAPQQAPAPKSFSISIARLGINNLTVTHPADALTSKGQLSVLQQGVGHLFSYPGRGGKIMIYGHSSGYAWDVSQYTKIFTRVNELKPGDRVVVNYDGQRFEYEVTHQQTIAPTDVRPFTGRGEELILYTCWPVGTAKSRLIVHAKPITQTALR